MRRRQRRQRMQIGRDRVGPQIEGLQRLQPGVLVWREYREGFALAVQDLVALEHGLILEGEPDARIGGQRVGHGAVALDGRRLVVMVGEDGLYVELPGEPGDRRTRGGVQHDQAAACRPQRGVQRGQRGEEEGHAAIAGQAASQQRVDDVPIEYEYAPYPARMLEGIMQRRVVIHAQVAAKPDQCAVERTADAVRLAMGGWVQTRSPRRPRRQPRDRLP